MTMRATPLATIICLALLALTLGCNPPTSDTGDSSSTGGPTSTTTAVPDEIVLGAYMPNTGPFATFGQSSTKAMRMAVEEINAAGGVLGAQIKLIVEDDQCKPEEAANAAQKLIHQDEVLCVIGEVASSNSLAAAPICQDGKTPMVTPSSTNPEVTRTGDYIFRVCFTDDFQGLVMAKFALDDLSARTAVIFSDIASATSWARRGT